MTPQSMDRPFPGVLLYRGCMCPLRLRLQFQSQPSPSRYFNSPDFFVFSSTNGPFSAHIYSDDHFSRLPQAWVRPAWQGLSKTYIISSESISLSTFSTIDWAGVPNSNTLSPSFSGYANCFGLLVEAEPGLCLSFPEGHPYSSCQCGPRLLTDQVLRT